MPQSLVTIGVTAYNAADTIERAIFSALEQSWRPIEIVVVDDQSTDSTFLILQELELIHEELRVFQNHQNGGVAVTRNRILQEALGEFLAFFDDDDVSFPERIAQQFKRIAEYESRSSIKIPVICHTARLQKFPDGSKLYIPTMGDDTSKQAPHGERVAERILFGKPSRGAFGSCATCSQMGRTSMYRKMGGFDESMRRSEDTEFNIRLAQMGGHFIGIKDPLVIQTMILTGDKPLQSELALTLKYMEKHKKFIDERDSYNFCIEWIEIKYLYLSGQKMRFWSMFSLVSEIARWHCRWWHDCERQAPTKTNSLRPDSRRLWAPPSPAMVARSSTRTPPTGQ